jgi:16S rRNA (guanine(966)-N(2))-methyltransferase RsmD
MRVITGKAKGIPLQSPRGYDIRPTTDKVKGAIFNRIMNVYPEDVVLDLYAGAGGMGIEFLSRGAKMVKLVDMDRGHCRLIEENLQKTHLVGEVICNDVEASLRKFAIEGLKFDIIFMDPPYEQGFAQKNLQLLDSLQLLKENGMIIVEHEAELSLNLTFEHFTFIDDRKYGSIRITYFKQGS